MNNLSKERLADIANLKAPNGMIFPASHEECAAMAAEILAYREGAKPVYQFIYNNPHEEGYTEWLDCNEEYFKGVPKDCRRILFTAPPLPVVPDGYAIVPRKLTAENGAKGALLGEFLESKYTNCPECFGDDECESCDGSGRIKVDVTVSWSTIKNIYSAAVELLGNPEQVNYPVTPDCWCRTCRPVKMNDSRFVVCPDCGNKRCPRASDHRNICTGSNEPGQEGSAYPSAPKPD